MGNTAAAAAAVAVKMATEWPVSMWRLVEDRAGAVVFVSAVVALVAAFDTASLALLPAHSAEASAFLRLSHTPT